MDKGCLDLKLRPDGASNSYANMAILRLIRSHPYLPIVKHLFHKCERATNPENWDEPGLFAMDDVNEIILKAKRAQRSPNLTKNGKDERKEEKAVDEMLFDTMVGLRIHLAELHRLSELCNKFVQNYQERIANTFTRHKNMAEKEEKGMEDEDGCDEKEKRRKRKNGEEMEESDECRKEEGRFSKKEQ